MKVNIRFLGLQDYQTVWRNMQTFTNERDENTRDEIWFVQHPSVFTQGQNGKAEHLLNPGNIPVIQVDRGGQITYHGPGQLVVYPLIDLKRKKFNVRQIVTHLENAIIDLLSEYQIKSAAKCDAPGVYVNEKKIASIGLRIRRGCSFHGLALNVAMDLSPFLGINPCGFNGLEMTQIAHFVTDIDFKTVENKLLASLMKNLEYTDALINEEQPYGTS